MKTPKVFLSHNKKDKEFIIKVANDLRSCGIDVWYDEWEIPPGESLRKKIFEDGITSCDVFFVYLTDNSIDSVWVQKELDSAFIHEIEHKNSFILLFVDKDETRDKLSLDLKALNIPQFNLEDYLIPFGKIISKTWISYLKNELINQKKDSDYKVLELENKILLLRQNSFFDYEFIKSQLDSLNFKFDDNNISYTNILFNLKNELANGIDIYNIKKIISKQIMINNRDFDWFIDDSKVWETNNISHFTGELILKGLLEIKTSNDLDQVYYLTKEGIEFVNRHNS